MKIAEVLRQAGLEDAEDWVARALAEHLTALEQISPSDRPLSTSELELLDTGKLDLSDASTDEAEGWNVSSVRSLTNLIVDAFTTTEAADFLHIDRGLVLSRLERRSLYGFKVSGDWRIPRWQFVGSAEPPGLEEVLLVVESVDPMTVSGFFTTPSIDLSIDGEPMSPIAWLTLGRPAAPVAALAASLLIV